MIVHSDMPICIPMVYTSMRDESCNLPVPCPLKVVDLGIHQDAEHNTSAVFAFGLPLALCARTRAS
jgi:hypothetical protein